MWAGAIAFFTGFIGQFLKTALGAVVGKIAIFFTLEVMFWALGQLTAGDRANLYSPLSIFGQVAAAFTSVDEGLGAWPGVVWALNYFMVPYGVHVLLTALLSSWLSGVILKAATAK